MSSELQSKPRSFSQRHPVAAYFLLTFTISWLGAFAVAAPHLLRHKSLPKITGILMFPAMLLGPSLSRVFLTGIVAGKTGLRDRSSRLLRARVPAHWYAPLLIPPVLILTLLLALKTFLSPMYTPNFFLIGVVFGVPAGLLEEIGWTGFAFLRCLRTTIRRARVSYSTALGWLHGSLVIFSPRAVSDRQELVWYPLYAAGFMNRRSNRGKTIGHPPGSLTAIQKRGSTDFPSGAPQERPCAYED
jgi:hypothetical protein